MQGDLVIVRAFGGVPLVRRVWDEDEDAVYITDDAGLEGLLTGDNEVRPIGFPREDVFRFDPTVALRLEELLNNGAWDWNKLDPF